MGSDADGLEAVAADLGRKARSSGSQIDHLVDVDAMQAVFCQLPFLLWTTSLGNLPELMYLSSGDSP